MGNFINNWSGTYEKEIDKITFERHVAHIYSAMSLTGKYIILLPVEEEIELGNSYTLTKVRLENLLKRIIINLEIKKLYVGFLDKYLKLCHMIATFFWQHYIYNASSWNILG